MKMSKMLLAAAVTALTASGAASAVDLIQNGDFENVAGVNAYNYVMVGAGSNAIANWNVDGVSVDVINNSYGSVSGNSIDMLGTPGPGVLSQNFFADAGMYTLSFDLSRNPYSHGAGMDVFVGGNHYLFEGTSTITNYTFNVSLADGAQGIVFSSVGGDGYSGAVLDNVSLTAAVPEPETYGMMLAGLGLVGAIARRRKMAK